MVKANDRRRSAESLALPQWGVAATRAVAAVAMIAAVSLAAADVARGFQPSVAAEQSGVPLKAIHISYKLDSRLTGSTYGGERWVSPRTYVGVSGQTTVDVRVAGVDASGTPVDVAPAWG